MVNLGGPDDPSRDPGAIVNNFEDMRCTSIIAIGAFLLPHLGHATIWTVGPGQTFTTPSQVASLVQNGDTVDILAGTYPSDVTNWTADDLLLRGLGGFAVLASNGLSWGDKAIWVIQGDRTTVEWIAFADCTSTSNNGAGIRQEGHDLIVRHCLFHDNENGILAGTVNPSNITIEFSEFAHNGYGDGFSHNLYINHIDTLIFRFNYSHHAHVGQELKSRAHVNFITYNRIGNEATGDASREIDLPDGGQAYLIGNSIQQGPMGQNSNLVGYGVESLSNPGPHRFYAINNTLVNEKTVGSYFAVPTGLVHFKVWNNILAGGGTFTDGVWPAGTDTASNLVTSNIASAGFISPTTYDYHITDTSPAHNLGSPAGVSVSGVDLVAYYEYVHPTDSILRCQHALLDAGAFETCTATGITRQAAASFLLYPDPVSDLLHLVFPTRDVPRSIEIVDMEGRTVHEVTGSMMNTIDVRGLTSGTYGVRAIGPHQVRTARFIKH